MRPLDRRLLRRLRPVRLALAADVVAGLVATGCLLLQALLVATVVATLFAPGPTGSGSALLLALAVTVAARATLLGSTEALGRWSANLVMSDLRRALGRRGAHGRSDPSAPGAAELATAAVAGVDALEVYLARYLPQLVLAVLVPVAVLVAVLLLDPVSVGVMAVTLPVLVVFLALVGRNAGDRARARWAALNRLSAHVLDVVRGLPTLRAYNRAGAQAELVAASSEEYRRSTLHVLRLSFLSGAVLDLAATIGTALVAVTVGVRLDAGSVDLRTALAVLLLTPELYAPLRTLGTLFHASTDGLAAAARILEVLDDDAGSPAGAGPALPGDWSQVRFENVTVRHPGRTAETPANLDLDLRRGEVVALVGASGAGKSTVADLLLGLRAPDRGRITVDGRDLATLDPAGWRRQIGWLPQHPTMFRGTIRDNIALGDPDATPDQVREAARLAGVDAVVSELPRGYDTVIGPGGRGLSLGEQRRVALARALVGRRPLLVLDEPTAHLDGDAVAVVAEALARLAPGRAVLLIEHRPELVPAVDRVVELPAPLRPERAATTLDGGPVAAA